MNRSALKELLQPFAHQRGWLMQINDHRGKSLANNGDLLMHRVLHDICKNLDVVLTDSPAGAEFIAVPPNGALLDRFQAPEIIKSHLDRHKNLPVIIFPSSAQFLRRDPRHIFADRSERTLWILREPYSYRHLSDDWGPGLSDAGVDLCLDHDVVISGSEHVPKYFPKSSGTGGKYRHLLVPRLGAEASNMRNTDAPVDYDSSPRPSNLKKILISASRSIPDAALRPLRHATTKSRIQASARELLAAVPEDVRQEFSGHAVKYSDDISDTSLASFAHYSARISEAEIVISNRLHVIIPAALLGKESYLIDSGYHKLRGIYEHSLQHLDNLTFVARS